MEVYHDVSSQSFDVIGETPKTDNKYNKTFPTEEYDENDNVPKLDEDLSEHICVPCNTPRTSLDSYAVKKNQITEHIQTLKTNKVYSPTQIRREIAAINRHLYKLLQAEKNGISFEEYKNRIVESYKLNNNVHVSLKNIYS